MIIQKECQVLLTAEEVREALRDYVQLVYDSLTNYPEGPTVHQEENGVWRLYFYLKDTEHD
jgi:hypothetical protein